MKGKNDKRKKKKTKYFIIAYREKRNAKKVIFWFVFLFDVTE